MKKLSYIDSVHRDGTIWNLSVMALLVAFPISLCSLPIKVLLVKAMVFPLVTYGCESWTIKKAECEELMLLNCGVAEDS